MRIHRCWWGKSVCAVFDEVRRYRTKKSDGDCFGNSNSGLHHRSSKLSDIGHAVIRLRHWNAGQSSDLWHRWLHLHSGFAAGIGGIVVFQQSGRVRRASATGSKTQDHLWRLHSIDRTNNGLRDFVRSLTRVDSRDETPIKFLNHALVLASSQREPLSSLATDQMKRNRQHKNISMPCAVDLHHVGMCPLNFQECFQLCFVQP